MLQGVHAETVLFTSFEQARSVLIKGGWSSIGIAGTFGGRDVKLPGTRPRRFRMQVTGLRESGKTISCQVELHDAERLFAPLMRVELSFTGDGTQTRVRLRGSWARDLSPASPTQDAISKGLANEYARALLDQIAKAVEARSAAKGHRPAQPRAAKVVLQKRR